MVPRMRSIGEVVKYFKESDSETQISDHFVRTLIRNGFPHVMVGTKNLIDLDLFIKYLNGEFELPKSE